jgi:hypothetical protein
MQKKFLIPLFITLIFNTLIAVLLFLLLGNIDFNSLLFISHSIGLSVLGANFLIPFEQYSNDIGKIISHSTFAINTSVFLLCLKIFNLFYIQQKYIAFTVGCFNPMQFFMTST